MELFTIERYEGDSFAAKNNAEKESQNLAQLLEQARGRKRSVESSNYQKGDEISQTTIGESTKEVDSVLVASPKLKKKKKGEKKELKGNKQEFEDLKPSESVENGTEDDAVKILKGEKTSSREGDDNDNLESNTLVSDENGGNLGTPNKGILKSQMEMTVIGGENKKHTVDAVRRTLPKWLANPSYFSSDVNENLLAITEIKGLHANLVKKLEKQGVEHFFPVQKSVIPAVLSSWEKNSPFGRGGFLPQDICVCAPTGSGKTLSYVLPVIELLRQHTLRSLEALVIVPTKDLATQVWNVFNTYVEGTGLSVGLANGIKGLQKEKRQLGSNSVLGYSSNVNILVATPGRLVEHISSTEGFSLQFLRFFIIDEADRLLAEPYFGWLDKVYGAVFPSAESKESRRSPLNMLTPSKTEKLQRPLQKLLFSATLTQNPEKLALLQLYKPTFFTVSMYENTEEVSKEEQEEFGTLLTTPATLEESMYICNSGGKPLVLLHLLTAQSFDGILCFTSSVESTHRLYLLLKHFGGIGVQEFSSNLSAGQRQTILNDFKCGQTQIIICSDAMARGLDIHGVKYVISYDPPVSSKTYVHRVGRTARAGKTGTAITLLHDNEVFHFKKMLKSLKKGKIGKHSIKDSDLECLMKRYETALEQLQTEVTSSKKQMKRVRR